MYATQLPECNLSGAVVTVETEEEGLGGKQKKTKQMAPEISFANIHH